MANRSLDTDVAPAPAIGRLDLPPLAVDAAGVARLLDMSERHVWALHSSGRLPLPVALGRSRRWVVSELRDWLTAGCPTRDEWQQIRDAMPSGATTPPRRPRSRGSAPVRSAPAPDVDVASMEMLDLS